jgi:hypothetical protein
MPHGAHRDWGVGAPLPQGGTELRQQLSASSSNIGNRSTSSRSTWLQYHRPPSAAAAVRPAANTSSGILGDDSATAKSCARMACSAARCSGIGRLQETRQQTDATAAGCLRQPPQTGRRAAATPAPPAAHAPAHAPAPCASVATAVNPTVAELPARECASVTHESGTGWRQLNRPLRQLGEQAARPFIGFVEVDVVQAQTHPQAGRSL